MQIFQYYYSPVPKLALALLVFSLASFARAAKSEIIVIDNFDVESPVLRVDYNTAFDSYSSHTSGTIKGNTVTRDMSLTRVFNDDDRGSRRSILEVYQDVFSWSNDSQVQSSATLNHHFSPINVLSPFGSEWGSLQLDVVSVDLDAEITITLVDANNQSAVLSETTSVAGQQILEYAYDDFLASNSNLDLTQIKSVSLDLAGPAEVDFTMQQMLFNTPEPSSVMLFSLAGIGLASRRRRKRS